MPISDYDNVKEVRISRDELYELVWTERQSDIAKKYYISENGLIKKCQEWNIPMPNLKYWIQLKDTTNPPTKVPLPQYSGYDMVYLKLREDYEKKKESIQKKISNIKKEIEEDSNVNLKVPERLTNPDPLIATARDRLYKKEVYRKSQGIIHHNQGSIGIYVTPSQLNRALRFMDTMIKALRSRGHHFINQNGSAHLAIYGEDYRISCQEKERRIKITNEYGRQESQLEPTGRLSFRLGESYFRKEWTEGKIPIEEQVSKILASVEYRGRKDHEERIENEKQWEERRQKQLMEKEIQDKKEKELDDFKEIFKLSLRHDKAQAIRRFADKLEQSALSNNDLGNETQKRIEWIRKKADWFDPFIESYDELLDGIDRDELVLHKQSFYLLKD
ncbi:hypothetical protein D1164_04600 [Mariniphaga sediminis]|uniref:Uncharacterized protein n=1 Tax=Mariniphaga sediminis TaxID=1628158 RepID=A0A399D2K6_9BACT|nr:hypothetical protein [Mariniphaga sediminis]RIH66195.1 hypothetical protein D1164_04600 [Mariniphaga sediminis]